MQFKIPKELEKVPIIAGLPLKLVVLLVVGLVGFFMMLSAAGFFIAVIPLVIIGFIIYLSKRFPRQGELLCLISYNLANKHYQSTKTIDQLLIKKNKN